jgi:hypothetical protein
VAVGGRMAEARLMLRILWKRGVVVHGSDREVILIWRLVRVPILEVWAMVTPVAPFPRMVRRSDGGQVRCCRQVAGLSV